LRYARSNGHSYVNWEPFADGLTNPTLSDSCEFDGDRFTEYVSYEQHLNQFALGDPHTASFDWRVIASVKRTYTTMVCIDWNNDGKEDLWTRATDGKIRVGISDGTKIAEWIILETGIGSLSYADACDLNGDGQDEVVAYEPGIQQMRVAVRTSSTSMSWRQLLPGIAAITGLTCGNFTSHAGDETIVWQPDDNGRYMIGEFTSSFSLLHWDPLKPAGLSKPFNGEIAAGDIDGDGRDELIVNEYRTERKDHSVMVGNITTTRRFEWYPFIEGITAEDMEVGNFVD
jgi:hypothetical protein